MWTTVFSDDGDMAASEYDESITVPYQSGEVPTASGQEQKSYFESTDPQDFVNQQFQAPTGQQPYLEKRITTSSPTHFRTVSNDVPPAESAFAKEYLIYADRDQQDFLEQYGRDENKTDTQNRRLFGEDDASGGLYREYHSGDGSFEVQMEDPFSPTSVGGLMEEAIERTAEPPKHVVTGAPKRSPIAPAETGTLQSKRKKTPEITITSHEEEKKDEEDSDAETSPSSDEDDYPDQVNI